MSGFRDGTEPASLKTINIVRPDYGRRYSVLPVDTIDQHSLMIDCTDSYMRPFMYDLRVDDMVCWLHEGRYLQGRISKVERTETSLSAILADVQLLPPDFSEW